MFSISLAKMCEGRDMNENVKLIGLFVARTFEENNLNFNTCNAKSRSKTGI